MVASIFRLRARYATVDSFRLPGYPVVPCVFIGVMALFLIAAFYYNPLDSLIGLVLTLAVAADATPTSATTATSGLKDPPPHRSTRPRSDAHWDPCA